MAMMSMMDAAEGSLLSREPKVSTVTNAAESIQSFSPCCHSATTTTAETTTGMSIAAVVSQDDQDASGDTTTGIVATIAATSMTIQKHKAESSMMTMSSPKRRCTPASSSSPSNTLRRSPRRSMAGRHCPRPRPFVARSSSPSQTTTTTTTTKRCHVNMGLSTVRQSPRKRRASLPPLAPSSMPPAAPPPVEEEDEPDSSTPTTCESNIDTSSTEKKDPVIQQQSPGKRRRASLPPWEVEAGSQAGDLPRLETMLDATTKDSELAAAHLKTPPNSSLKPLISKTPLRDDGTPLEPSKARQVYENEEEEDDDDDDDDQDENEEVNRLMPSFGSSNENYYAIPKSPLAEGHLDVPPSNVTITLPQLQHRILQLFQSKVVPMDCVAARLFACFSLYHDSLVDNTAKQSSRTSPSPRKKPRREETLKSQSTKMLLAFDPSFQSLLSALVDLEIILLQQTATGGRRLPPRQRRVHFAAFDGSALQPPSDVMEDSQSYQQAAINGLTNVLNNIQLWQKNRDTKETSTNCCSRTSSTVLRDLVDYLLGPFQKHHADICAASLSNPTQHYPVARVLKAAKRYATDLQPLRDIEPLALTGKILSWHRRLADAAAQLVRYWLRTNLNPVPGRARGDRYSQDWNSRVCNIVSLEMEHDNKIQSNAAVEDDSLSSLVSYAASHVYFYFGGDWKQWKSILDSTPTEFGQDLELCRKGIAPLSMSPSSSKASRRQSGLLLITYSADAWHGVAQRVEEATGFLAAVNGAKFLYELLTIVVQYPEYHRSWEQTTQQAAIQLTKAVAHSNDSYSSSLQDQDAHLLLLQYSPRTLLQQLPCIIDWTRKSQCERFLFQDLPRNFLFHKDNNNPAKRRKRPHQPFVSQLEQEYDLAMSKVVFPTVIHAEPDDDDDDIDPSKDKTIS